MLLSQMPLTALESALLNNPTAQFFPWALSDFPFSTFPQGVPRASVLSAYQTAAMQFGNFTFKSHGSDNFQRASENPLSQGGNWNNVSGFPFEVATGQCYPVNYAGSGFQVYTGVALSNNQWASVTLGMFEAGLFVTGGPEIAQSAPLIAITLRSSVVSTSSYIFIIQSSEVRIENRNSGVTLTTVNLTSTPQPGDVWTAAAIGSTLLLYQNGTLIANASDSQLVSGYAGLAYFSEATPVAPVNYTSLTNFACGSVIGALNLNVA